MGTRQRGSEPPSAATGDRQRIRGLPGYRVHGGDATLDA
jgi:hypothetical protein